jgi:hypothetical protein
MYDGLNRLNSINNAEIATPPEEEPSTYQQYKKERQEITTIKDKQQ